MTAPIGPEVPESFPEPSAAMMRMRENASDYLEHEVGVFATVLTDLSLVAAMSAILSPSLIPRCV